MQWWWWRGHAGRDWWWIFDLFWFIGCLGWWLLMLLARQWLLSTNPCVSSSVCSGHGQGILDAYSVQYHWADGVWYPYLPDLTVLPVIEYHWIVAFHSCHLPFQTPGIMNRCPTKRYLICIFKLLNCLLDFSRRFIITTCHEKTVGSEGKPAVHSIQLGGTVIPSCREVCIKRTFAIILHHDLTMFTSLDFWKTYFNGFTVIESGFIATCFLKQRLEIHPL